MDGTSLPVDVGVMPMEPWINQDKRQVRVVQNVQLDGLVVIARQEYGNLGGLVRDCAQSMAIKGPSGNRMRQRNPPEPQLLGLPLTDDAGISTRVYQGSQGVGTIRNEKPGLENQNLIVRR